MTDTYVNAGSLSEPDWQPAYPQHLTYPHDKPIPPCCVCGKKHTGDVRFWALVDWSKTWCDECAHLF